MDVDLKDPLTGGDGHIDCIKVHDNDDNNFLMNLIVLFLSGAVMYTKSGLYFNRKVVIMDVDFNTMLNS